MAGNSRRRGAIRKPGTKKGPTVGSGGVRRRGLEGKGATPPAHERPHHPAAKRAAKAAKQQRGRARKTDDTEIVLGRNPVVECLRAGVPATALYVALGAEADERLTESVQMAAADAGISILEVPRHDLDRIAANGLHQGRRAAGPAVLLRPSRRPAAAASAESGPRADGGAGQHLRPPKPRCDRPIGRRVRRPRRADPATPIGVRHGGGVADQRGCGGQGAGGACDESHS